MSEAIHHLSAGEIADAVGRRRLSVTEVAAAFLARTESLNPGINAVCTLNPRLREEAREADARLAGGGEPRPLEGVPFLVKDVIETRGIRTSFGSRIMQDHVPEIDALSVTRLKEAGAIVLGKTNTPEFATDINTTNAIFGMTRNPWDVNVTPGGSSGGTGAGVAAEMAPIGLGTDLGGSIRIPASFNGIVGLRPSTGRVPVYPQDYGWDTLVAHVHGPMARRIADLGLMLAALAGPHDLDPSSLPAQPHDYAAAGSGRSEVRGRRIAFCLDLGGVVPVEPEVAGLVTAAARRLEGLGCPVEEACFDASDLREIISGTRGFNMIARYIDRYEAHRDKMAKALLNQIEGAMSVDVRTVTRAERRRTDYWHRVRAVLTRFDYIVTPTIGAPPFRLDEPLPTTVGGRPVERFYDVLLTCYGFSITGLPALSVPCGFTRSGLPVGMQIVGRRHRDDQVLELGAAFEAAAPEFFQRPRIDLDAIRPVSSAFATPGIKIG